jgi:hypothetical protein
MVNIKHGKPDIIEIHPYHRKKFIIEIRASFRVMLALKYRRNGSAMVRPANSAGTPSIFNSLHLSRLPAITDPEESTGHTISVAISVPVSDFNPLPNQFRKSNSRRNEGRIIDEVPAFPRRNDPNFHAIFERKVALCKVRYSFTSDSDHFAITAKTNALNEFLQLLMSLAPHSPSITAGQFNLVIDILEANLIHKLPPIDVKVLNNQPIVPYSDPSWCHLSIIYKILDCVLVICPSAPRIHSLAKKLLTVASTADPNERNALTRFYIGLVRCCPDFRYGLADIFETKLRDLSGSLTPDPYFLSTVLPVLHFIFTQTFPLIPHAEVIFSTALLPLVTDPYLVIFETSLSLLVDFFIDMDLEQGVSANAMTLLPVLLMKWPHTNSGKQAVMLNYLMRTVGHLKPATILKWMMPFLRIVRSMSESPSEKVASTALLIWSRPEGERLLAELGRVIVPSLLPTLRQVSDAHWSAAVRTNAVIAVGALQRRDVRKQAKPPAPPGPLELPQYAKWSAVLTVAHEKDKEIQFPQKMTEIARWFRPPITRAHPKLHGAENAPGGRPKAGSVLPPL